MSAPQPATALARTPLYSLHIERGARMVAFAGYEMPVHYPAGILKEHLHVRAAAGLFDVSHMGQLSIRARSGVPKDAALALESVAPIDCAGLRVGRQRYALLTNDCGGILDDLMIANLGERFVAVVNAASKHADEAHFRDALSATCEIERYDDYALLALQGPKAETVMATLIHDIATMRFMDARASRIMDVTTIVTRSGYTGEDGFEISVPADAAEMLARELLKHPAVALVGLGARDSLRLEAGLCLYGADIDTTTTPIEAALEWSIAQCRRGGGARAGGFPGADLILGQLDNGAPRRRVGLRPEGRAPIRHGTQLGLDVQSTETIGVVTSGGFGPSLNAPIAMGYVASTAAAPDTLLFAERRGERMPVRITKLPFIAPTYKR